MKDKFYYIVICLAFVFITLFGICYIKYNSYNDSSDRVIQNVEYGIISSQIIDKYSDRKSKYNNEHIPHFVIKYNGHMKDIKVSLESYYKYNIGDTFCYTDYYSTISYIPIDEFNSKQILYKKLTIFFGCMTSLMLILYFITCPAKIHYN